MSNKLNFKVCYEDQEYEYNFGSKAYIFDCGLGMEIPQKYGIKEQLIFVNFVHELYIKDANNTPLGPLADYVAEHWPEVKKQSKSQILEAFYDQFQFS